MESIETDLAEDPLFWGMVDAIAIASTDRDLLARFLRDLFTHDTLKHTAQWWHGARLALAGANGSTIRACSGLNRIYAYDVIKWVDDRQKGTGALFEVYQKMSAEGSG